MSKELLYKQEQMKVTQFEACADVCLQENQTQLSYRNLNADFFNLEKQMFTGKELKKWEKEHVSKKKAIEDAWHKNTEGQVSVLKKRGGSKSKKEQAYYRNFSLEDLEVFIKNSNRSVKDGNSDEYNNVATNLELYNRIKDKGNPLEAYGILINLKKSANVYIGAKSPNSTKGKIRKAIISEISSKATTLVEEQKQSYISRAERLFKEAQMQDVTDEKVNEAFRAQYDLIYQVLNGNIELSKEELKQLDNNTANIFEKVLAQDVDEGQIGNVTTKFFNALGWSRNEARIVKETDLDEDGVEMKKSPLKKKMYHAINPVGKMTDATEFGRQLAGTSKTNRGLFYGLGRFGKGIYTSARGKQADATDEKAESNSWTYGKKVGAVQLVMTLNENARMIPYIELQDKTDIIKEKFGKFNDMFYQEKCSKGGYVDYLTMQAALFGYNTLIDYSTGIKNVDYYVTTDRKAFSISNDMRVRSDEDIALYYDIVKLKEKKNDMQK